MNTQTQESPVTWRLEAGGLPPISLVLPRGQASDLFEVARLQGRSAAAVVGHVLSIGVYGRMKVGRLRRNSSSGSRPSTTSGGALSVEADLINGLSVLATTIGVEPGVYCGMLLTDHLYGVGRDLVPNWQAPVFRGTDSSMTVWLPEELLDTLKAAADVLEISGSDLVRSSLFSHLHGRLGYERAVLAGTWRPSARRAGIDFSEEPGDSAKQAQEAPRTALIRMIGKSEEPFTLVMATALRAQLAAVAERAGLRASEYLRRHLATYLLGRLNADALPLQGAPEPR